MPKLTLPTVQSGYYTSTALNTIFDQIELEFEKVLYRINPVGTPNSMSNDVDMNGNDILNADIISASKFIVNGTDFTEVVETALADIGDFLTATEEARDIAVAAASSASSSSSDAQASMIAASLSESNAAASEAVVVAAEAAVLAAETNVITLEGNTASNAALAEAAKDIAVAAETAVLASEANVEALEAVVQALSAQFRGTYYGALSSDPTLDPLGNAPTPGDLYFNDVTNTLRIYSGGAWDLASVDPDTLGTAATYNVGVAAHQIPTNGDLPNFGNVVTYNTGSAAGQVPRNMDLGTASQYNVALLSEALSGVGTTLPDVSQVHAAFKQFGLSVASVVDESDDLNNLHASGFYSHSSGSPPINAPAAAAGKLIVVGGPTISAGTFQIWSPRESSQVQYRQMNAAGVWTPWIGIITEGNIASQNVNSAATLTTARTINGTSFNGSANITTSNWGTTRTVSIAGSSKSVNGSANITWSLADLKLNGTLTTDGIQYLPSGLIIQWGFKSIPSADTNTTLTFPTAFPTACIGFCIDSYTASGGLAKPTYRLGSLSAGSVTVRRDGGAGGSTTWGGDWIAIGY